jgi:hypothetical protein
MPARGDLLAGHAQAILERSIAIGLASHRRVSVRRIFG